MSSDRELLDSALLKQGEEALLEMVDEKLLVGMPEQKILPGCSEDEFLLQMFKNIPSPPRPSGAVVNRYFTKTFNGVDKRTLNNARKIIGPGGFTVRAIEQFSGCKIRLNGVDASSLRADLSVVDYENVSAWRIEAAKQCIDFLINRPPSGRKAGDKIQSRQLAKRTLFPKNHGSPDTVKPSRTGNGGGGGRCGHCGQYFC
ncbi:Polyribonucleotide nucleotidyltransferase [Trichinella spiralis]|uniref:Polyribonucleotide nucleotidyltransferase n=2 Tax=Trichinella spiralis TaxID=6334 RepID=A0ABR3KIQ5_TRISP|nr:putative polyribonucleotide nucleotidyltransferase [Trichinella spiralis]KRY29831.1 hypothetical protein T01_3705 [Trichinella spiralis]